MHLLRTAWLLTIVALCGAGIAFAQHVARSRAHREAEAGEAVAVACGGLSDCAPRRDDGGFTASDLVARVRRRGRAEPAGSMAQVVESGVCPWRAPVRGARSDGVAPSGEPQARDDSGRGACRPPAAGAAAGVAADRLAWRAATRQALARPVHGAAPEPPPGLVTFGFDGPRLVPLTLFD